MLCRLTGRQHGTRAQAERVDLRDGKPHAVQDGAHQHGPAESVIPLQSRGVSLRHMRVGT